MPTPYSIRGKCIFLLSSFLIPKTCLRGTHAYDFDLQYVWETITVDKFLWDFLVMLSLEALWLSTGLSEVSEMQKHIQALVCVCVCVGWWGDQRDREQSVIEEHSVSGVGLAAGCGWYVGKHPVDVRALAEKTNHEKVLAGKRLWRTTGEHLDGSILFPPLNSGFLCLRNPQTSGLNLERAPCGMEGMGCWVKTVYWLPLQLCWCQPGGSSAPQRETSTPELRAVKPAEAWAPLTPGLQTGPCLHTAMWVTQQKGISTIGLLSLVLWESGPWSSWLVAGGTGTVLCFVGSLAASLASTHWMPVSPFSPQLWHQNVSQFSSVAQSCPTLCDPVNCSTPGLPVHHQFPEFTQTHVHRVGDTTQPSHPLSSPSPPAPNPSQHQHFQISSMGKISLFKNCYVWCVWVVHSCLTVCHPTDCSPPGSSVQGILWARILERVAIPLSRGSSRPRYWTWVSCIEGKFFTVWATRGALLPSNKPSREPRKGSDTHKSVGCCFTQ